MQTNITKGIRLDRPLVKRIERFVKEDGSNFSQFFRTAALRELKRREEEAA